MQPCRSSYCECGAGKCTHPGFYDARNVVRTTYFSEDAGEDKPERRVTSRSSQSQPMNEMFNGLHNVRENHPSPYWKGYITAMLKALNDLNNKEVKR